MACRRRRMKPSRPRMTAPNSPCPARPVPSPAARPPAPITPRPPTGIPATTRPCPKSSRQGTRRAASPPAPVATIPTARAGRKTPISPGLNADYLARQLREMKSGARHSAEPRKHNAQQMVDFAQAMTEAEITEAATYYASLPPTVPIKVVESATVPKMRSQEGMWLPHESGTREPIGTRVIETPANVDREQLRDPHAGFIAYVPPGAPAKGKKLAAKLGCAGCHGESLKGDGRPASPAARPVTWRGNCTISSKAPGMARWRRRCSRWWPNSPPPTSSISRPMPLRCR